MPNVPSACTVFGVELRAGTGATRHQPHCTNAAKKGSVAQLPELGPDADEMSLRQHSSFPGDPS